MRNVLADLALECESDIALVMRLARAFDTQHDEAEALLASRVDPSGEVLGLQTRAPRGRRGHGSAGAWLCRRRADRAPVSGVAAEFDLEGSGNVMCLDVLRALSREPRTRDALMALLAHGKGRDAATIGSSMSCMPSWVTSRTARRAPGTSRKRSLWPCRPRCFLRTDRKNPPRRFWRPA